MPRLWALLAAAAAAARGAAAGALSELTSEEEALEALARPSFGIAGVEAADVERLVHRGWHDAVRALIAVGHRGSEEDSQHVASQVRQAVQAERNRLDDLTRALDRNYGKTVDVTPASQWAQNSTHVFLAVKFAQRWNAPGALEVATETVDISACCLNFTAFGEHSFIRRRYRLSLELFRPLSASASSWSSASVGRVTLILCKAKPGNWPLLLASGSGPTPKNLGIWRDMKEKWQGDVDKYPPIVDTSRGLTGIGGKSRTKVGPASASVPGHRRGKGANGGRTAASRPEEEDEDTGQALAGEAELLSACPRASVYAGSAVVELCKAAWPKAVEVPRVSGRRWLVELYGGGGGGKGEGDVEATKSLTPVWRRLADVFPSRVPGGRVGAVDCRRERELCGKLGVVLGAETVLPQIRRVLGDGSPGKVWTGGRGASVEEFVAFGGGREEL